MAEGAVDGPSTPQNHDEVLYFAIMEDLKIEEALTFDSHFESFGLRHVWD